MVAKGNELVEAIRQDFGKLHLQPAKKALYLIWKNPYIVVGRKTFIDEMLPYAGFENLVKEVRYPELMDEEIREFNPEYILLSSEPFPFREKHINTFKELCPDAKVMLVDGEMFSWYGSRLRHAPAYFRNLMDENASL